MGRERDQGTGASSTRDAQAESRPHSVCHLRPPTRPQWPESPPRAWTQQSSQAHAGRQGTQGHCCQPAGDRGPSPPAGKRQKATTAPLPPRDMTGAPRGAHTRSPVTSQGSQAAPPAPGLLQADALPRVQQGRGAQLLRRHIRTFVHDERDAFQPSTWLSLQGPARRPGHRVKPYASRTQAATAT